MKTIRGKALDQVSLSTEVASLLPSQMDEARKRVLLSHQHGHRSRMLIRICPQCGGTKSPKAVICKACLGSNLVPKSVRISKLPRSVSTFNDVRSTRHVHSDGEVRPQPAWSRKVLVDGEWVEADE